MARSQRKAGEPAGQDSVRRSESGHGEVNVERRVVLWCASAALLAVRCVATELCR
jgi:hypothetical protein